MEWKKSRAHLLLLSNFLTPSDIEKFSTTSWENVLREKPVQAIKRFYQLGLIAQPDVSQRLSMQFGVPYLKELLKERGLKVSGKKSDLIVRLLEADTAGMHSLTANLKIFQCSEEGKLIAEKYVNFEKQYKLRVEVETTDALQKRDFKKAALLVATYESKQVFKRSSGLWVSNGQDSDENSHWETYDPSQDIVVLISIFNSQPQALAGLSALQLGQLKMAVAMKYLWGATQVDTWLPADFNTNSDKDNNNIAHMLHSHALYLNSLARYRKSGVSKVTILSVNDEHVCSACQKLAGKVYSIDKVPELPYPKCTCEFGCRCHVRVQID